MPPHLRRARIGLAATSATAVALAIAVPTSASASAAQSGSQVTAPASWTAGAAPTGAVADSAKVTLTAVLQLHDMAGAQQLALAVSDPKNALYRHFLTPAQWRSAYAPTAAEVASVTSWLSGKGFAIGAVPANGRYVQFTGTVKQAEAAFGTSIDGYVRDGQRVQANSKPVYVPSSLSGLVAGIAGLDTSAKAKPDHIRGDAATRTATPHAAAVTSSAVVPADQLPPPEDLFRNAKPCSSYYGAHPATGLPDPLKDALPYAICGYKPPQIRGGYGLDATQRSGTDGRGTTVAVIDAYRAPYILDDAQTYAAINDPSHPFHPYQLSENLPTGYTDVEDCDAAGWYGEETLDVEAVHATAPGANVLYAGGASCNDSDLAAALNTVIDNNLAQIITNSYGEPETAEEPASTIEDIESAVQAAAEGITLLFSSGDDGDEIVNTGLRQADAPANDPFVTAVGGTNLHVGKTNNWEREVGWGTGKSVLTNGAWVPFPGDYLYGGGGGESRIYPLPSYQYGVVPMKIDRYNTPTHPMRVTPDIAMNGDPTSGMLIGEHQTFPDGSIGYSEYRVGGTSLSSPLLAGLLAVTEQSIHGELGFVNPVLYHLHGTPAFHDVNDGTAVTTGDVRSDFANGYDASDGLIVSLRTENQTGTIYTRKGYDDVTGLGTPNAVNLLPAVQALSQASTQAPAG